MWETDDGCTIHEQNLRALLEKARQDKREKQRIDWDLFRKWEREAETTGKWAAAGLMMKEKKTKELATPSVSTPDGAPGPSENISCCGPSCMDKMDSPCFPLWHSLILAGQGGTTKGERIF
ncbi:hypothetical protein SKAU_G00426480 [Synaphobranchus kaupii]|uniref:Uncharacterized protein n=1 Tax=Synaphobranchus kaupii TaxID=118154 RepID=A0A9Q1I9P8_SYNKA|nr:hypothetical protein SKAU_G00426480 [Synaphobranchus kaupii]